MIHWRDNLSLIGFMGSGKSTVGPMVASMLGMFYVDLDEIIEKKAGSSVADIFDKHGETGFRKMESAALKKVLAGRGKVVSCGGGVILDKENVLTLRSLSVVFLLLVSEETARRRLQGCMKRPLLKGEWEDKVSRLYRERLDLYRRAAHFSLSAEEKSPVEVAEEIVNIWKNLWWK